MCFAEDAFRGMLRPGLLARAGLAEATTGLGSNLLGLLTGSGVLCLYLFLFILFIFFSTCFSLEMKEGRSHLPLNGAKSGDLRTRVVLTGKVSDTYLSS